jgi:heme exporter protein B
MSQLVAALRKELLLQWRGRAQIIAVLAFGGVTLLLLSLSVGPNAAALRAHAPGALWVALLLASTLALSESFHAEMENRALEGLLLLPADPRALYYGKALANWAALAAVGCALVPEMIVLYDAPVPRWGMLVAIVVMGTAGVAAPGTLYAAMTSQAKAKQMLLPLLLFPLVVPVELAAIKATSLVLFGDPMGQLRPWLLMLVAFAVIHWSLAGLLFDKVVED